MNGLRPPILRHLLSEHERCRAMPKNWRDVAGGSEWRAWHNAGRDVHKIGIRWRTGDVFNGCDGSLSKAATRELRAMEGENLVILYGECGRMTHVRLTEAGEALAKQLRGDGAKGETL